MCKASLARQRERFLDAYLAGLLDLGTFERRTQGLDLQDDELLARARDLWDRRALRRREHGGNVLGYTVAAAPHRFQRRRV